MSTAKNIQDDFDFMPDEFAAFDSTDAPESVTVTSVTRTKTVRVKGSAPAASAPAATVAPAAPAPQPKPAFDFYGKVPDESRIATAATMRLTDMGLGARIAIHYEGLLAWQKNGKGGAWFVNLGTHWAEDIGGGIARSYARIVIASITNDEAKWAASTDEDVQEAQEALNYQTAVNAAPTTIAKAQANLDIKIAVAASARIQFGERCENGTVHITAALEAAQTHLAVGEGQFDTNPYLVNFQNGTLDVRTLELKDHDPKQYITKVCAVDYVEDAVHADLDKVLATLAKNDPGLPLFLQRYLGAATTGLNKAKAFVYLKGLQDAGKSTLFEAFAQGLGDLNGSGYGRIVSPALFALGNTDDGEKAQPKLHDLRGVRFIFADEAEKGFMNRETVNKMSAGGRMNTRALHGNPTSWKAQSKIVFAGNDYMPIPDNDPGLTRRLITVELKHNLTTEDLDVDLQDRIVTTPALEAIMAWAIRGAHEWIEEGADKDALHPTQAMEDASAHYLASYDPLGDWWDEYVLEVNEDDKAAVVDEDGHTRKHYVPLTTSQWHKIYVRYCIEHKATHLDFKRFGARLTARGFEISNPDKFFHEGTQLNHGKFRRGIRHRNQTVISNFDRSDF